MLNVVTIVIVRMMKIEEEAVSSDSVRMNPVVEVLVSTKKCSVGPSSSVKAIRHTPHFVREFT